VIQIFPVSVAISGCQSLLESLKDNLQLRARRGQSLEFAVEISMIDDICHAFAYISTSGLAAILSFLLQVVFGLLGSAMVRASDLRSSGRGFDSQSRPGRYRAT